jgi:hypothetical protein
MAVSSGLTGNSRKLFYWNLQRFVLTQKQRCNSYAWSVFVGEFIALQELRFAWKKKKAKPLTTSFAS